MQYNIFIIEYRIAFDYVVYGNINVWGAWLIFSFVG